MTRPSLVLITGLLVACLWVACGKTSVSGPALASADPAVEAENRLWTEATVAEADARHDAAVRAFRHYLANYPNSPRQAEGRWRLGQVLEQAGDLPGALAEYRTLLSSEPLLIPTGSFQIQATERLNELRHAGVAMREVMPGHTALSVSPAGILAMPHLDEWLAAVRVSGVTVLALDVGCDTSCAERLRTALSAAGIPVDAKPGVLFSTTHAAVVRPLMDELVPQAHRAGLSVIAIIDLLRAPWLGGRNEWQTAVFDPRDRVVRPWPALDLLNPSVNTHVGALLSDLVRTDLDGVLIRTRSRNSFAYEVGETALATFEVQYRETPADVMLALARSSTPARHIESPARESEEKDREQAAGTLWHWVGWKARQEFDVLAQLRRTLQQQRHGLRVIVEIHAEALSSPLSALVNYGEDAAEVSRRGFDILLNGSARTADVEHIATLIKHAELKALRKPVIGQPTRQQLWLLARVQGLAEWVEQGRLRQEADRIRLRNDINVLLAPDIEPGVP